MPVFWTSTKAASQPRDSAGFDDGAVHSSNDPIFTPDDYFSRPRPASPPPPLTRMPFTGRDRVAILDEPFDWSDGASVSSRGSSQVRQRLAGKALMHGDPLASQKHPITDAALNIYVSQLRRTFDHYRTTPPEICSAGRARWLEACSLVSANFFWYRQNPGLVATQKESAQLMHDLIKIGVLAKPARAEHIGHAVLPQYVTQASLIAAQQRHSYSHPALQHSKLLMVVVALNMSRDAGLFEFFELRDIYGFTTNQNVQIELPLLEIATNTEEACKMRCGGGQVTAVMVLDRKKLVARRQREVQTLIREYTVAKRQATALFYSDRLPS